MFSGAPKECTSSFQNIQFSASVLFTFGLKYGEKLLQSPVWLSLFCPSLPIPVQKQTKAGYHYMAIRMFNSFPPEKDLGWRTLAELHRSLIKQGVGEETELLMHSFHCLKTNVKGQRSYQTHIRSCYETPGGKTEHSLWGLTYVPNSSSMTVSAIPDCVTDSSHFINSYGTYAYIHVHAYELRTWSCAQFM